MAYQANVSALAPFGLVQLRAKSSARTALEAVLGFAMPLTPDTTAGPGEPLAFSLGPDEWLLRTGDGAERDLTSRLRQAVRNEHAAVTTVSDAHAIFALAGPEAARILMQGTSIDLDPRVFAAGRCARIRFAKMRALLHAVDGEPTYHLYVPRSYGLYAERWLRRARGL